MYLKFLCFTLLLKLSKIILIENVFFYIYSLLLYPELIQDPYTVSNPFIFHMVVFCSGMFSKVRSFQTQIYYDNTQLSNMKI